MNSSIEDRKTLAILVHRHYKLAEEAEACIQKISQRWKGKFNTTGNITKIKNQLANSEKSLNTLTLRMPIVAPIKAGKSTIINALVGEDLLPSRNEAMTVLPTEVRLISDPIETCLKLTDHCIHTIQRYYDAVKNRIESMDDKRLVEFFEDNARLKLLVQQVLEFKGLPLKNITVGADAIKETLQFINDLVRITIHLFENGEGTGFCEQFQDNNPAIEVTYESLVGGEHIVKHILTIVDTPGPNESSKKEEKLYEIVSNELKNADLVLVTLDYTKLGSAEDARIAAEIANIQNILKQRTVDNVYALVNKTDQRRRGDRSPNEVKAHIKETYKIVESNVFELKAAHALAAKKYMRDFDYRKSHQLPEISLRNNPLAQDLINELYHDSDDYEEYLDKSPQDLYDKSDRVYKNSGIRLFLQQAINSILHNILKRCMKTCVDRCRLSTQILMSEIDMLYNPLQSSTSELEKEIIVSENEIKQVEENRQAQFKLIEKLLTSAKIDVEEVLDKVNRESEQQLEKLLNESSDVWREPETWISKISRNTLARTASTAVATAGFLTGEFTVIGGIEVLATVSTAVVSAPVTMTVAGAAAVVGGAAFMIKSIQTLRELDDSVNGGIVMKFASDEEVKKFLATVSKAAVEMFNTIFTSSCKAVDNICNEILTDYERQLQDTTQELLSTAPKKQRQSYCFETMKLSPLNFSLDYNLEIEVLTKKRYRPLWGLGIFELETTSEQCWNMSHSVSRVTVEEYVKKIIRSRRQEMRNKIVQYIDAELAETLDKHFSNLNNYLNQYQEYLKGMLEMKKRSAKETKDVQELLESLKIEVEKAETLLEDFNKGT